MDRSLVVAVAGCGTTAVEGSFQRHVSPTVRTLTGTNAGGRWGPAGGYSVLYLGRPTDSIIAEAYRHLVDDVEGMTPDLVGPRRLLTVDVHLTNVLDLRIAANRAALNIADKDIRSDPGNYARCQRIGRVAHQLGLHGIIAPAATGLGETLAVFELHLPTHELPMLQSEEDWPHLPPDPRTLRVFG